MWSKCSALKRLKTEENVQREDDSTARRSGQTSPLLQRRPSPEEHIGPGNEKTEEALSRPEERASDEMGCGENTSSLLAKNTAVKVYTPSPRPTEAHDSSSAREEEKEADWVDKNRAKLIQNVTSVLPIADQMLQQSILHKEMYANIRNAGTSMEMMRELYKALTSTKAKSAFFRILQEIEPSTTETEDVITDVMKKYKEDLRNRFGYESEGNNEGRNKSKSLDKIYTELHIIQGESKNVNTEHEIWEIQDKSRSETTEGAKIHCNDIFKNTPDHSAIRTVMTKGIAGIGKTVSVKKFILDWADGSANQDFDYIFVLTFRELNLVTDDQFSLESLVKEFHSELKKVSVARIFDSCKVLFIFDGLDESQLKLDFKTTKRITDPTQESCVDTLVTNLIREHLLPKARVWITSRPGAVHRIPRNYVYQWTEVRGFDEPQKIEYFKRRFEDQAVAERIINHVLSSQSLYIMCHIPIFCWIAAKVLEHLLLNSQDKNIKIPTTLTEMYTHFLYIQIQRAEKYDRENESDTEEMFQLNEEFIFKLGRMAFEHLNEGKIIFTGGDLKNYDIDLKKAGVYCGLCTEILKQESVFNTKKLYCFVHLTVQEYFAALFVYRSFASKKIDSPSLKDFLLTGSEEELKSLLDVDPVDLPVHELIEISITNSTLRKTGELDMFLRFLIGMSLLSTQELLQGLIQQEEQHSVVVEEIRKSLLEVDLGDCSPERCLNLVHCLIELKDSSLHDTVQQYLTTSPGPETQLSPVQCSALADSILMSNTPLEEFNLKKYRPSEKGIFRLIPAVRNCRIARISGVWLNSWLCEAISSALRMPNSVLTELHLINNVFCEKRTKILIDGLNKSQCKLEALSLAGRGMSETECEKLAAAIKSIISNLRELELSGNVLDHSLCSVLSVGLCQAKLEKLRLNRNHSIGNICEELVTGLTSNLCNLRELELSYTNLKNSDLDFLSTGLMSETCKLEVLSLSHNKLTEKGCETLASVLSSKSSHLKELDLSYNAVTDSGVMALCSALMKPLCCLKSLRLSFCKVTGGGCTSLASALRSDHRSLRELDLSFNHLTDKGVELLTEIQKDPCRSLETLNVEQNEDCWFDLKLLRKYACDLTLDPNTAGDTVILSEDKKQAKYVEEKQPRPSPEEHIGPVNEKTEEEALSRQEERASDEMGCGENSSSLLSENTAVKVYTPGPCPSETPDSALAWAEKEEADWVDKNRAKLIQNVTSVLPIADQMFQQSILHKEMYANICNAGTSMEMMRELYKALTSTKAKSAFFRILQETEPSTTETKLEKLRLNQNPRIGQICKELVTGLTSNLCNLRELELRYTNFDNSDLDFLSTGLMSETCKLEVLSLSHNKLTEKGCETLASVLSSKSSHLKELDLSYNAVTDSGVMALCSALMKPLCCLKSLRLSFCKVTGGGCTSLASALRSDHCSLRELDLSFNHLTDKGAELLTEIQKDPCRSLETLNVEQNEDCWFNLKLFRKYACDLTLDPNTAGDTVILSEDKKMAEFVREKQPYPDHPERFDCAQVLCEDGLTGRHYWEVECSEADVGVAYKRIEREGDCSSDFSLGKNENSWCWYNEGRFSHNNVPVEFVHLSTHTSTIGVYLDWPAGILSFFEVFRDTMTLLCTVRATFTEPLHPGFFLYNGSIRLCKIK
ncbi:hypothetical protein Q5P01_017548 [Channa striata]|uniref:NACHT, LRR and PYD domains-containing protein 12-like n=1 Tax=Channa striata TaxID=64152 RepID=A0AA88SBQ2_CHASR|nr:hypothetical protein Q5P01_017548 [Channa striata]